MDLRNFDHNPTQPRSPTTQQEPRNVRNFQFARVRRLIWRPKEIVGGSELENYLHAEYCQGNFHRPQAAAWAANKQYSPLPGHRHRKIANGRQCRDIENGWVMAICDL